MDCSEATQKLSDAFHIEDVNREQLYDCLESPFFSKQVQVLRELPVERLFLRSQYSVDEIFSLFQTQCLGVGAEYFEASDELGLGDFIAQSKVVI